MKRRTVILLTVLVRMICILTVSAAAESGNNALEALLTGQASGPAALSISSPSYGQLAQFAEDRRESLNRLLSHVSLDILLDGPRSETAVCIDSEQVFSVSGDSGDAGETRIYSFEPETAFIMTEEEPGAESSSFSRFLDRQFYFINRMTDDLYPLFSKTAERFAELSKNGKENLNYKGYGKAVRKVTIQFPAEYAAEHFSKALAELAGTEESSSFIQRMVFSGKQKIVLLYDEADHVLRINYDGIAGLSEDSLRKVSLVWRCLRSEGHRKDLLTLKTPAVKGNDRYNLSYSRDCDLTDPEKQNLVWDFQLDLKSGDVKRKIMYSADFSVSSGELTGTAVYSEKENGTENRITVSPALRKENDAEYKGTIEFNRKTGKILTSSIVCQIRLSFGNAVQFPENKTSRAVDLRGGDGRKHEETLQDKMYGLLIRRLLQLPGADTEFLSKDIPEESWNSLIQSLQ